MKIAIKTQEDGTFKVCEEADDLPEAVKDDSYQEQPAATLDEALEIASQMLSGGEAMAPGKSPEELFQGGFTKASGVPLK